MKKTFKDLLGTLVQFSRTERVAIGVIGVAVVIVAVVSFWSREPLITTNMSPLTRNLDTASVQKSDTLFDFDPNTVTEADLTRLGFSPNQIRTFIKYRAAGVVFRTAADFARCYAVSERKFDKLKSYIKIEVAAPQHYSEPTKQKSAIVISDLNRADTQKLTAISGIGNVIAARIIDYRNRLGGFAQLDQLAEVHGMNEERIQECRKHFFVNCSEIKKIDINFVTAKHLSEHPYMSKSLVGRVLRHRELKGGWSNITEMTQKDILLPHEAEKLAPYLVFLSKSRNLDPL